MVFPWYDFEFQKMGLPLSFALCVSLLCDSAVFRVAEKYVLLIKLFLE